eukprot:GHVU01055294.1.p1 GENE.GHVU01055294.1~~GHVU01055294.1.p1  ORF type:complete len:103 (+),score=8.17 GHVU01055294.1:2539-2847(+)
MEPVYTLICSETPTGYSRQEIKAVFERRKKSSRTKVSHHICCSFIVSDGKLSGQGLRFPYSKKHQYFYIDFDDLESVRNIMKVGELGAAGRGGAKTKYDFYN